MQFRKVVGAGRILKAPRTLSRCLVSRLRALYRRGKSEAETGGGAGGCRRSSTPDHPPL